MLLFYIKKDFYITKGEIKKKKKSGKIKKFLYLMLLMLLMLPLKKLQCTCSTAMAGFVAVTLMLPQQKMMGLMLPFASKYCIVSRGTK